MFGMKRILFAVSMFCVTASFAKADEVELQSGHYESEALVCAYNIQPASSGYYGEADDSETIQCGDKGVVLKFTKYAPGRYRKTFSDAQVRYEWEILNSRSFVERVKRKREQEWRVVATYMFKLTH